MSLLEELTTGPLAAEIAPHIASGDDGAIAAILNRKDITVKGSLSAHDIRKYLMLVDLLLPIESSTSQSCLVTKRALGVFPVFDLSDAVILGKFTAILDGLVADTLVPDFTETHKATLLYMSEKLISRAEQLSIDASIPAIAQALRG